MSTFSVLRTVNYDLTFRVDHYVPVYIDTVIHKLRVEPEYNYKFT